MRLWEVNLYQDCSNYSPGVKIDSAPGVIDFHYVHIVKNKKIFLSEGTRHRALMFAIKLF
jgi:hypothetical protein